VRCAPVEIAIHKFASNPSRAGADKLIALIEERSPTRGQGARILKLLLWPEVTTRSAYPAGQPAKMSIERRFPLEIPQSRIVLEQFVWAGGQSIEAWRESSNRLSRLPQIVDAWVRPLEPGTYQAQIRTECRIMHAVRRPTRPTLRDRLYARLQSRLPGLFRLRPWTSEELTYKCRFVAPFDINIVERDQAERLELMADPQTADRMRTAITLVTSQRHGAYETAAGRRGHRGSMSVTFKTLPAAAAFELSLRLADGRELPAGPSGQPQQIRVRAGEYASYMVDVGCFGLEEPGHYTGTLVLKPDPDQAYEDPAIKALWNGTLEFPVSFTVYVRTRTE
jgi:hypothetical protein